MKVVVSILDLVFTEVETTAKRCDAMNAAVDNAGNMPATFNREAARRIFAETEWTERLTRRVVKSPP